MKRLRAAALVIMTVYFLAMTAPVLALHGAVFIVTDHADQDYFHSLGLSIESAKCALPHDGYGIIYVLDYNTVACGGWPRGLGEKLLELAEKGAIVILGYNTLRFIDLYEPIVVKKLGLTLERIDTGTETIRITLRLKLYGAPASLKYDSQHYHRFYVIKHTSWKVLAWFSDGSPAIAVMPFGHGLVVLLFFNPIWPAVEGQREYLDLAKTIHKHITGQPIIPPPAATAAVVTAAAIYTTSNPGYAERVLRRIMRSGVAVVILAHRVHSKDATRHPLRAKIIELVEKNSYVTVDMIIRELGVKRTSAIWHLTLLTNIGLLATSKILNKQIYYRKGRKREAILASLLEAAPRRQIVLEMLQGPCTISQLARSLNMSKSTVKHHIDVMRLYSIVEDVGYGYKLADWVKSLLPRILKEKEHISRDFSRLTQG